MFEITLGYQEFGIPGLLASSLSQITQMLNAYAALLTGACSRTSILKHTGHTPGVLLADLHSVMDSQISTLVCFEELSEGSHKYFVPPPFFFFLSIVN